LAELAESLQPIALQKKPYFFQLLVPLSRGLKQIYDDPHKVTPSLLIITKRGMILVVALTPSGLTFVAWEARGTSQSGSDLAPNSVSR
jgi:hypothetical protein